MVPASSNTSAHQKIMGTNKPGYTCSTCVTLANTPLHATHVMQTLACV
jgi:hypothetical protein